MKVNIKKLHKDAVIPTYSKPGDAGMDLTAVSMDFDSDGNIVYGTGLAMEVPEGHVALLFPRSSIAKKDLSLSNSVGVIDSGYRGEIFFKFKPSLAFAGEDTNEEQNNYEVGDRIGQVIILPYPQVQFTEVGELSSSERGAGGFGSTGN